MIDYSTIARPSRGFDQLEIRSMRLDQASSFLTRTDLGMREREEAQAIIRGASLSRRRDAHGED